jgi:alanyl-tRNA synthetase
MTTTRRYYDDSYTTRFSARVVESLRVDDKPAVVLDQTYFYPTGGGQPNDIGRLTSPNGKIAQVIDVQTRAEDKAVLHILSEPLDGDTVECEIDWARRFDLMQQHTGQHILSQAFIRACEAGTVGFHLGTEAVTIDLDKGDLNIATLNGAESLANEIVFANTAVTTRLISPDDAEGIRMRRVPDALATNGLRVVEIGDFDMTACGGTHVAHTGEVGMIKLLATEKYKGGTRITFVCGFRALHEMQMRTTLLNWIASDLSCAIPDIPDIIAKLREGSANAEKNIKGLRERLTEHESAKLIAQAEARGGLRLVMHVEENGDSSALRLLAARVVRKPGMVAMMATAGDKVQVICARSADVSLDMNALLKATLAPFGGKGGGQPAQAQGGAGAASRDAVVAALHAAADQIMDRSG